MKELTIEEKAQRYNEAISKMKEIITMDNTPTTPREIGEYLFSELKESEDEKIRKELIAEVKEQIDCIPAPDCRDKEDEKVLKKLNKWLAWLEKQGKQKLVEKYNITGIGSKNAQGKLGEMIKNLKSANKIEPKFKVGDIIINKENGAISKINNILPYDYELISLETRNHLILDQNVINGNSRLWTIQDAKNGDILRIKNLTFIFQEITNNNVCHKDAVVACCSYEDNDDAFGTSGPDCITDLELITPTTKEQRDLLFQKMKDAGYEWDVEKKELKKFDFSKPIKYNSNPPSIVKEPAWTEDDENVLNDMKDTIKNVGMEIHGTFY